VAKEKAAAEVAAAKVGTDDAFHVILHNEHTDSAYHVM